MSNGKKALISSKDVSSKLLLIMKQRGRLPMPSLSVYARQALAQRTEERTRFFGQSCRRQQRSQSEDEKLAKRRAKIFSNYSSDDLVTLDSAGVKILGVDYEIDNFDGSWAE